MPVMAIPTAPDVLEELWEEDFESLQSYFPDEPPKSLEEVSVGCPIEVYVEVTIEVNDRLADHMPGDQYPDD